MWNSNYISPEIATRSAHGLESIFGPWAVYTLLIGNRLLTLTRSRTCRKVVLADYEMPFCQRSQGPHSPVTS